LSPSNKSGEAGELVVVAGALDKLTLILTTNRLGLRSDLNGLLVVAVAGAGGLDQAVNLGVADDLGQTGRDLREGGSALVVRVVVHKVSTDASRSGEVVDVAFTVVSQSVTVDGVERQHLEHFVHSDDVFDDASDKIVLSQLRGFGQSNRSHGYFPFLYWLNTTTAQGRTHTSNFPQHF